ncbi:hypothetical protein [Paracoccus onubensis]|uniref:Uncharacterized protein n=1 Tax=Paracoccus onubensis TaxID=1675788 RepID=A0A418T419_9RHOB|nr:hypothetical protein [Paracoccus onubensis]RJE87961.1 hypothetical protein D3P04_03305 [Paracoccus onubensis]
MRFIILSTLFAASAPSWLSAQELPETCEYAAALIESHKDHVSFVGDILENCKAGIQTGPVCSSAQKISINENQQTLEAMKAWVFLTIDGTAC